MTNGDLYTPEESNGNHNLDGQDEKSDEGLIMRQRGAAINR